MALSGRRHTAIRLREATPPRYGFFLVVLVVVAVLTVLPLLVFAVVVFATVVLDFEVLAVVVFLAVTLPFLVVTAVFLVTVAVPVLADLSLPAWAWVISPASTRAATQAWEIFLILRDMQARSASEPRPY